MNYNELRKPIIFDKGIFVNFTGRYLLPQLKIMKDAPLSRLDQATTHGFALCDRKYPKYTEFDNKLFVVLNKKADLQYWMDRYEYYMLQDGQADKIVIIFDLPINNRNVFLEGRYSELYLDNPDILSKFIEGKAGLAWSVVNKTDQAREDFEKRVNKDFALNPPLKITLDQEYEYPPVLNREILHYTD